MEAWNMSSDPKFAPKKPYQRPALRIHGNIEALTATVSNTSLNMDGGSGGMSKTH
jgi:hypothetical protein